MFLKRAFFSLLHNWWKNLLLILLFASLFAVAIGSLTLYGTTKAQTDHLQKALGNAVTLKALNYTYRDNFGGTQGASSAVLPEHLETFAAAPQVEGYNFTEWTYLTFPKAKGLYEKEYAENPDYAIFPVYNVNGLSTVDSSLDQAFTVYGFQLIEGEHLTQGMLNEDVCLISQPFAELNGLHVGDNLETAFVRDPKGPVTTLRVKGIFQPPESSYESRGQGDSPEEIVFLSPGACYKTRSNTEEDMRYSSGISFHATVYLRSPEDVDAFVAEMKQKLPIREVLNSHFQRPRHEPLPEELLEMNVEEALAYVVDHPQYDLILDREWYDMVGKPLEKQRDLAGAIAVFLLASILLVLVLTTVLLLAGRKRETGILLSMGEGKLKIMAQLAIEILVPLCFAMAVGLPLGMAVGGPVVENLCGGVYQQSADYAQQENNLVTHASKAQDQTATAVEMPTYASELINHVGERILVYPKAAAQLDAWSLGAYLVLVAGVSLLAVCIQAASVFRLKPAKILTGKG